MLFPFVQFELTHAIGPPPGRYVLGPRERPADEAQAEGVGAAPSAYLTGVTRGVASADLIVLCLLGAAGARQAGRLARRRAREEGADAGLQDVAVLRASFIRASTPFADRRDADRFVDELSDGGERAGEHVERALRAINEMIRAHRAAGPDPYAVELTPEDARAIRVGYGGGQEVANGTWLRALSLPTARIGRVSRAERVRPTEELAAALAGRAPVMEGEDVLGRVLLDLDQRRPRAAARQLDAALALLIAELRALAGDVGAAHVAVQLESARARAHELSARAVQGGLTDDDTKAIDELSAGAERALSAWRLERGRALYEPGVELSELPVP
jgi:hypothetical protein